MLATDKKNQESPNRQLFYSEKKGFSGPEDCEYCRKKQRLSNGDETQRCLMHTINFQKCQQSQESQASNIIEELTDLLTDIEDLIEEYWSNLHRYSNGSPQKVKDDLSPVFEAVTRIEQKLGRFPFGESFQSPIRLQMKRPSFDNERKQTRSQKVISTNFAELFEDTTVNDQIKQWVIYFHKILINRELRDELLPFDDEIDMKIFKESMQRKFVSFAKNYSKYQARLSVALQKLLFYMQACGSNVNEGQLQADIKFMQSNDIPQTAPAQNEFSLLMMQALTIEDLLAKSDQ